MGNSKMLNAAVLSNVGLLRRNNEDNYILGHCLNDESKEDKHMIYKVAFLNRNDNYFKTSDESSINKEDPIFYLIVMDKIEATS